MPLHVQGADSALARKDTLLKNYNVTLDDSRIFQDATGEHDYPGSDSTLVDQRTVGQCTAMNAIVIG
jgi:hypothetical protein